MGNVNQAIAGFQAAETQYQTDSATEAADQTVAAAAAAKVTTDQLTAAGDATNVNAAAQAAIAAIEAAEIPPVTPPASS
jgi:hypothetical protein